MLKEFNDYLTDQIGQPYVWGGRHTRLSVTLFGVKGDE